MEQAAQELRGLIQILTVKVLYQAIFWNHTINDSKFIKFSIICVLFLD